MDIDLDTLFNKYKTDKGSEHHNYSFVYEKYLQPLRYDPIKILEIGVQNGYSLKSWYEYFPKAQIIGMDIDNKKHLENDRIKTFKGHQGMRAWLKKFTNTFGKDFDVIIDDGSHFNNDIIISLGYFYSHLKPKGLYFIEDLQGWLVLSIPDIALKIFQEFQKTKKIIVDSLPNTLLEEEIDFIQENTKTCNFYCDDQLFILERN